MKHDTPHSSRARLDLRLREGSGGICEFQESLKMSFNGPQVPGRNCRTVGLPRKGDVLAAETLEWTMPALVRWVKLPPIVMSAGLLQCQKESLSRRITE